MYKRLMKRKCLFTISVLCMGMLLATADYLLASSICAENAECKSVSCGSAPKVQSDGKTYVGCKEKLIGTACTGQCEQCTGSTVDYHCVAKTGETCYSDTGYPSTSCGTTTYYPCTGATYPNCSCNTASPTTSTTACSLKTCESGEAD